MSHTTCTEYEIAWQLPDGRSKVFAYSQLRTKDCLLRWAKLISGFIIAHSDNPDARPTYDKATGWNFRGVKVFYTGATKKHPSDLPR
jgi:hypothetical protein